MKLLFDQGTPTTGAAWFRALAVDAWHTQELGMARALDQTILLRARDEQRVLVCYDKDFPALLALSRAASPSVISVRRQGLDAPSFCAAVEEAMNTWRGALELGAIVVIGKQRMRCRPLPIS